MPNVVLGVSGSVAAYRAADLARELMRQGFTVRVCLTDAAQQFVTPALFEALTGEPCLIGAFEEPVAGRMAHIDWARQADVLVVAPASASTMAKLAGGIADDMLSTIALAFTGPLVVAPAMNPAMYLHEATRASLATLKARAAVVVEPGEGDVACGEHGQGKLASIASIASAVGEVARVGRLLDGKRVLVTSGPTQEPIDGVRFLSNRSSGKMGAALARAALMMGAEVVVVSGPSQEPMPFGAEVVRVRTAEQMLEAALSRSETADYVVGAAAVADYRPADPSDGKIRRGDGPISLELVPNPDIIAEIARQRPQAKVIGFAAEPDPSLDTAREKLARKGLAAIAVNDVSRPGIGFDASENELTLVVADREPACSGLRSKLGCALWLWEQLGSESR
jgi:phosphopantothenoylcysteine decarboxylase / phosphopantothenate---cysteine ligase